MRYTVFPGEWLCTLAEMTGWFRYRFQHQTVTRLRLLAQMGLIKFSLLDKNRIVKYRIKGWDKHNKIIAVNAPCRKDTGFFFFPISKAPELLRVGKCSEADILLDMWVHTVYNDPSKKRQLFAIGIDNQSCYVVNISRVDFTIADDSRGLFSTSCPT